LFVDGKETATMPAAACSAIVEKQIAA